MNGFRNSEGYSDSTPHAALKNIVAEKWVVSRPPFRPLVYICSPYSGDVEANTEKTECFCRFALDQGNIPVAPHLMFPRFMNDDEHAERDLAIFMDIVLMGKCQEVWVLGNIISAGMQKEIDRARIWRQKIRWFNLTLANGTSTGAIPCYYSGTTRITTHYAAGNAIHLTYRVNASVSGTAYTGWWADANYNTNTNYYDRLQIDNYVKAKTAITAKKLIVGDETGYFNLTAGVTFDITKPVLYAASAIKANATGTGNYIAYPAIAMTTAIASSWTGIINQSAYLKGTLAGQSFTVAATNWMTCEPLDDGTESVYMLIGKVSATSATSLYLYPEHPIYRFVNGALSSVSQTAYEAKMTADQNSENISSLVQRVNEVDLRLTDESIIGIVRGSAEYRNDIDNTSRFEALQTQITQALTSIDLRVSKAEMETYLRLISAGIVIGRSDSVYNLLLDDNALHIQQGGTDISRFQKNQLTVENIRLSSPASTAERYSIRTAPDGGIMFVMEG